MVCPRMSVQNIRIVGQESRHKATELREGASKTSLSKFFSLLSLHRNLGRSQDASGASPISLKHPGGTWAWECASIPKDAVISIVEEPQDVSRRENDLDNLYLPEYLSLPGHEFGGSVGGGQSGRIAGTRKLSSGGSGAEAAANKTLGLSSRWISPAHSLVSHVPQVISRGAGGPPLAPHGLGLQEEGGKGFDFPHGSCLYNLPLPGLESVGNASGSW